VLGHRRGFYGLVAEGWDLADFGTPWPRGPLPADMDPSELIVGFLDGERASGAEWSAAELSEQAAQYDAIHALPDAPPVVTDEQLAHVRARMRELHAEWNALPPGEAMELHFPPGAGEEG
jgi:hypothetical protein